MEKCPIRGARARQCCIASPNGAAKETATSTKKVAFKTRRCHCIASPNWMEKNKRDCTETLPIARSHCASHEFTASIFMKRRQKSYQSKFHPERIPHKFVRTGSLRRCPWPRTSGPTSPSPWEQEQAHHEHACPCTSSCRRRSALVQTAVASSCSAGHEPRSQKAGWGDPTRHERFEPPTMALTLVWSSRHAHAGLHHPAGRRPQAFSASARSVCVKRRHPHA